MHMIISLEGEGNVVFLGLRYHLFTMVNPSMGLGQQVIQTINNVNKNIQERLIWVCIMRKSLTVILMAFC